MAYVSSYTPSQVSLLAVERSTLYLPHESMCNADVTLSAVAKQYYMNFNSRDSSDYHIEKALLSLDSTSHNKALHSNRPSSTTSMWQMSKKLQPKG